MPKVREEQPGLPQLFKQLAGDGARVAEAELVLARAEAAAIVRSYVIGIAIGIFCLAMTTTALIILAQAGVIAIIPYVTNPAYAYLSIGLFLTATTIALALVANRFLAYKHRPIGMVFKWLAGDGMAK
jgi:Putative Actinobacterial Holin-X, holin superfamily III